METIYEMETVKEIHNNKTGEKFVVGPDRDGLGLLEIRYYHSSGDIGPTITMPHEAARLVAEAIAALTAVA